MNNLLKIYFYILLIIKANIFFGNAVISISGHGQFSAKHYYYNTTNSSDKSAQELNTLERYQNCLNTKEVIECLKQQTIILLDDFNRNNETVVLNNYIQINKNTDWSERQINASARNIESVDELLKHKLVDLAESRSVQIKFPIFSNKPEQFTNHNGRQIHGNIEEFSAEVEEGRKKKGPGKHGGGYMVGAMAIAAILGQLALGKVAFLAGAAMLIAKIALLLSLLSALKKQSGGTTNGEHVVLAADHGHSSYNTGGWQRSIDDQAQAMAFRAQLQPPSVN